MSQKILFQLTRRLSKTVKKYYSRPIVERTEWGYRIFQMHNSTGCPKKNYTRFWHRINQAHNIGPKCYWYHFLQNIFLHMLIKFQRIMMNTSWDISSQPKAPIFKTAHTVIILINARAFIENTVLFKVRVGRLLEAWPFNDMHCIRDGRSSVSQTYITLFCVSM